MNVFFTSAFPRIAATHLADQHSKMILEVGQMLSTVVRVHVGGDVADQHNLYRATHRNHPCVQHLSADQGYMAWVCQWGVDMAFEKNRRTGKLHKSLDVILRATRVLEEYLYRESLLDAYPHPRAVPLAMPEDLWPTPGCRLVSPEEAVQAYRRYLNRKYAEWAAKDRPAKWTNCEAPEWAMGGE